MSNKIKVNEKLVDKAIEVFTKAKKKSILSDEGLTRAELRALEKKGYVRKMSIFGKNKYAGSSGAVKYIWFWEGI